MTLLAAAARTPGLIGTVHLANFLSILPCSYTHAFYVKDASYRALFEDSQGLLIGNLEKLHSLLETHTIEAALTGAVARGGPSTASASLLPHDKLAASVDAWRQQVIGLITATAGFLDRFLEAVQHGFMAAGSGLRRSGSTGSTGAGRGVRRHKSGGSAATPSRTASSKAEDDSDVGGR